MSAARVCRLALRDGLAARPSRRFGRTGARLPAALIALLLAAAAVPAAQPARDPAQDLTGSHEGAGAAPAAQQAEIEALQRRLLRDPADLSVRRQLVNQLMSARRYVAAEEAARALGAAGDATRATALYLLTRYEEALALLPRDDAQAGLLRVDALTALGRTQEAAAELESLAALRGADDPAVLALRGRQILRDGRAAEAVPLFRRALQADPLLRDALFGLGQALLRSGAEDEGLALLERHRSLVPLLDRRDFALQSLELDPTHAPNHAQLAEVERQLGRLEQAVVLYERAALLARPEERVPIVLRHARLLAEDLRDSQAAVELLDRAIADRPEVRLAVRAGDLLTEAGQPAAAVERYELALTLRPEDAAISERLQRARAAAQAAADSAGGGSPP